MMDVVLSGRSSVMASRSLFPLGLIGALALFAGCHAGGVGNLAPKGEPILPRVSMTAKEAIEKHNLNASKVQLVDSRPRITVKSASFQGSADGRMALERPKNFKLEMVSLGKTVADIGSNDTEFWFWTGRSRGNRDNSIMVCSYDDLERTALSTTFQPEWVIEAMGLRSISAEEATQMDSQQGDRYGTIKLVSTRKGTGGAVFTKETIIDQTGKILEHRMFEGDRADKRKTLVASAVVSEYKLVPLADNPTEKALMPYRVKLEWVKEQLALEIQLDSMKLNVPISDESRQAKFSEPVIPGSKRVNLADYAPTAPARASVEPTPGPRTRSTRPAPDSSSPNSGIRLGAPEPFGVEGAMRGRRDPVALQADLRGTDIPRGSMEEVVRPGTPRPSEY
jgi:hypothetical protein